MRANKFLDFRPTRIRRRAMAMFLGSIVLMSLLLWVCWIAIYQFVELRYKEQLRNHVELLSSAIDHWPKPEAQDEAAREPEPDNPCRSPAATALQASFCKMIREAHYEYEGQASVPWLSAGPHSTGYFFLYNDNLDGIVHGAEPEKYERKHTEIESQSFNNNFQSIAKLHEEAQKAPGQIRCINYDWKPLAKDEMESKLGCVKQIKTALIPTKEPLFLGTGMLQTEISSHTNKIFTIVAILMISLYASMLLLFRLHRNDTDEILRRILDGLAVGLAITRKNETGDREKILIANRELKHLYGVDQIAASGRKGLEHKGLERIIPKEEEKHRKPDPDLESQRTLLDYAFTLERTGTKLLLRDVAVPLWDEDGLEMLHTITNRKHSDTHDSFLAQYKKYLPPLLFETKTIQPVRQATVLICELPGIIKLYEEKGIRADECAKDLNQYVLIMLRYAHDKSGVVDKLVGDKLVIHFGTGDNAREKEDTRLCLEAAVAIKAEIQQLLEKQPQQRPVAPIRMGIATGQLAASELGTADRADVILHGEAMILADLLCSACPAGQILVDERVKDNGSVFNFRDHELPKEYLWKEKLIRAFRLTGTTDLGAVSTKRAS